jgi:archaellum component FlaC
MRTATKQIIFIAALSTSVFAEVISSSSGGLSSAVATSISITSIEKIIDYGSKFMAFIGIIGFTWVAIKKLVATAKVETDVENIKKQLEFLEKEYHNVTADVERLTNLIDRKLGDIEDAHEKVLELEQKVNTIEYTSENTSGNIETLGESTKDDLKTLRESIVDIHKRINHISDSAAHDINALKDLIIKYIKPT